jgi:hypothetical protein
LQGACALDNSVLLIGGKGVRARVSRGFHRHCRMKQIAHAMQCTTARPQSDLAHKQIKAKKQTGRLLPAGRKNSALLRGQD